MRIYATAADAEQWDPANADTTPQALRSASTLVEHATRLDRYSVDSDGYPTTPAIRDAFRDATCAQVTFWGTVGIDPTAGTVGQTPRITSQSVPGGSVSYANPVSTQELGQAATTLTAEACRILSNAGLLRADVTIR